MSLMGSLWVGNSGLTTSQNALHTTSHNITNADTKGYTREQILQSTRTYQTLAKSGEAVSNQQVGLGVNYARTEQIRDVFLDQAYRKEIGRSEFYETSLNTMEVVEDILGELDGADFNNSLQNLWVAVQELSKDPTSATTQGLLVTRAVEFTEHAGNVYSAIAAYQDQMNVVVKESVDQINDYADQVQALNNEILKIEAGGIERANDLRDQRNYILDKLGELCNISYAETFDGTVTIRIEEEDLLKADRVFHLEAWQDPDTGFYIPIWEDWVERDDFGRVIPGEKDEDGNFKNIKEAQVFDLQREISTEMDTDVGGLKATCLARGGYRSTWEDIPQEPVEPKPADYATTAEYNKAMQDYNEALEGYDAAVERYNRVVAPSITMNIMAEFDTLIHNIVTKVNDAIDKAGYSLEDGTQLFITKAGTDFTTTNIQVNPALVKEPTKLSFKTPDGKADYDFAEVLKTIFTDESYVLNPNVATKVNLRYYYNSLVNQIGNSGSVYQSIYDSEQNTVNSIEEARQSVSGVSTDEELQFMIMFQNAYNASSRYINVVNEMLEHLLNSLT